MLDRYTEDIINVKKLILENLQSSNEENSKIINKYFLNQGKGLRMILALVCSKLGSCSQYQDDIYRVASIVEIIHTTTLIHDDIIDGANERRGVATLNKVYNDKKALFLGDFLFARVLNLMSDIKISKLHDLLAYTLKEICLGELLQNKDLYNIDTRVVDYLKKIKRKTAVLIAYSCAAGSIASRANDEDIRASYKFGYFLGMSYQIVDDYLDFMADNKVLGKDIGQDLQNGNITYPIILKIQQDKSKFNNFSSLTKEEKDILIEEIKQDSDILLATKRLSEQYLNKARESIESIDSKVKEELLLILDKISQRNY